MNKIIQILDITSVEVDENLYNITAINRNKDPYWVEFMQYYCLQINVAIKILPLDQIDFSKKWLINVDINMWNWNLYSDSVFAKFNSKIQNELKNGNAYIILNHQCESFTYSFFRKLYYSNVDIPFNKIIYMVAAADVEREYDKFVIENNIPPDKKIKVMYVHHVYKRFNHDVELSQFNYHVETKTKKFLSLNRRWRRHRLMLVSLLANNDLLKHGFVSLGVSKEEIADARKLLYDDNMILGFDKFSHALPLQIDDVDLKINQFQMNSLDIQYYQKSCFSLVSSTMALDEQEGSVGFTEKEVKPILAKHPFLIWNRPGVLKHLKAMGFLTFEPWFDESYDNENDDIHRLNKIIHEVKRLCSLSFDEWAKILNEMEPVLNHNYNRMVNYTNEHCFFNSDLKKLLYYAS